VGEASNPCGQDSLEAGLRTYKEASVGEASNLWCGEARRGKRRLVLVELALAVLPVDAVQPLGLLLLGESGAAALAQLLLGRALDEASGGLAIHVRLGAHPAAPNLRAAAREHAEVGVAAR